MFTKDNKCNIYDISSITGCEKEYLSELLQRDCKGWVCEEFRWNEILKY